MPSLDRTLLTAKKLIEAGWATRLKNPHKDRWFSTVMVRGDLECIAYYEILGFDCVWNEDYGCYVIHYEVPKDMPDYASWNGTYREGTTGDPNPNL